ncbi:MAG TPA: SIMPL domain-containing protein [Clostridia bacterium]|nr:SIMPL domain-containing protein [Clostridia bacterium]
MNCIYYNPVMYPVKKGYLKVTGTGTVKAIPDTAVANLGVVTENPVLEAARNENAVKSNSVVNMLTNMGIERKHIRTGGFSIDPLYDFIDGKQVFRGYRVSNILNVTIKDIARAGEIIDRATYAGVNRVDSINFTLSDQAHYYDNALRLAIENALHKASEIGSALNIEVDSIPYKIVEKSIEAPVYDTFAAKLSSPSTPLLPGQLEITSIVLTVIGYR